MAGTKAGRGKGIGLMLSVPAVEGKHFPGNTGLPPSGQRLIKGAAGPRDHRRTRAVAGDGRRVRRERHSVLDAGRVSGTVSTWSGQPRVASWQNPSVVD